MDKIAEILATFFFVGKSPKAPGTLGSLAALPFAWGLWQLPPLAAWSLVLATFLVGVWASSRVVQSSGVQDNQTIVIDEVVGIFVASAAASQGWHFLAAFGLFRFFDILKPGPVGWADRTIKGGLGVMVDDLVAGILAGAILFAAVYFMGKF